MIKLTIEACGQSREEVIAWALNAIAHAVQQPNSPGHRIANAMPSIHAPSVWVDYSVKKMRPRKGGKLVAVA